MTTTQVDTVAAFSYDASGGNPAGVVVDASGLESADMQAIATNLDHSESAFVTGISGSRISIRFFSPTQEVDFCGHATIAAIFALRKRGLLGELIAGTMVAETGAGEVGITVASDGIVFLQTNSADLGAIENDHRMIAGLLGLDASRIDSTKPMQIASVGVPKLLVSLVDEDSLSAIQAGVRGDQ